MQEGYVHQSSCVSTLSSRPPPPLSRRTSEHETVLPSVERETVDLISPPRIANDQRPITDRNDVAREYNVKQPPKRKAYPPMPPLMDRQNEQVAKRRKPSPYGQDFRSGPESKFNAVPTYAHTRAYLPVESRARHSQHPPQDIIDLTSSSRQPPLDKPGELINGSHGYPAVGASSYAFAPDARRRSPVRIVNHEQNGGARANPYIPEHDRMYQRHAPPAHEYVPLRR